MIIQNPRARIVLTYIMFFLAPALFCGFIHVGATLSGIRDAYPLVWITLPAALAVANIIFLGFATAEAVRAYRDRLPESMYARLVITSSVIAMLLNIAGLVLWVVATFGYSMDRMLLND